MFEIPIDCDCDCLPAFLRLSFTTCKPCPLFRWQFVVYTRLHYIMMNRLPPTFPNGYVQLSTPCLALVSKFLSRSQHLISLQLPRKSLWWFPKINMMMLSLAVTGLMCAHRQTTLRSYTCWTPSRVYTFQAPLDYVLDPPHHQVCIFSSLLSFRDDYPALGFCRQHQPGAAVDVPLYLDPGVLGSDATSNTPHTIVDTPNEYIDDMTHLLTSIESLSKPALVSLAKDHNISGPYNSSSDGLQNIFGWGF